LKVSRLKTGQDLKRLIAGHYASAFRARYLRRPVAWVTSGAPVELLRAMGVLPVYPENYGALCGARRVAVELCEEAEAAGYRRDLCSYARLNIGSMLSGRGPLRGRGLPKPDLLIAVNNICHVVVKWWEVTARHLGCPLYVLDVPFVPSGREVTAHQLAYVREGLEEMVEFVARHTGRRLREGRLRRVLALSTEATLLWRRIQDRRMADPSPASALDMFTSMFPMVTLRGTRACVSYLQRLDQELAERVAAGAGPVPKARYRLLWDNIAIWFAFGLVRYVHQRGGVFVAETYTHAWGEYLYEAGDGHPMEDLARQYSRILLNVGLEERFRRMAEAIRRYRVDGVVFHSCRSCKTYSLGQLVLARRVREELGLPTVVIEADMADPRNYAEGPTRTRLDAFFEILEGRLDSVKGRGS